MEGLSFSFAEGERVGLGFVLVQDMGDYEGDDGGEAF
jgi:hypothetical protein